MKHIKLIMGMPITVEIPGDHVDIKLFDKVFGYFTYVDEKFSTYKDTSEITAFNKGLIKETDFSDDMKEVFRLCNETKTLTDGYFDMYHNGKCDPSGLVKGWSIYNASKILDNEGVKDYYIDAGGDIQVKGRTWKIGIKNPFDETEIVKVLYIKDKGVATSGTYIRGQHIYNPKDANDNDLESIVSLTVIGPNVYEADRFATAAFAMEEKGIEFIQNLDGFEGYQIDSGGMATMTNGFERYTYENN